MYCPAYAAGVVKTKAYKELLSLLDQGYNLQILGYDGYDYQTEGKTLEACLNDTTRPFGHELVLVCLLTNQRVWEKKVKKQADGKVKNIDKEEVENEKVDNIDNGEIEDGKKEVEE